MSAGYARKAKPAPHLDVGYEVEWCANVPKDEDGENDLDSAEYRIRDFTTIAAARSYAKQVFPKDWFGSVRIAPFEMVPYEEGRPAKFKEYRGESEYYEGEDEASAGGAA